MRLVKYNGKVYEVVSQTRCAMCSTMQLRDPKDPLARLKIVPARNVEEVDAE